MATPSASSRVDRVVVGVADLSVVQGDQRTIVTHALGSGIGITVFDPVAKVGGMLHFMLDRPANEEAARRKGPAVYASSGIPLLFKKAYELGAFKDRIIVCAAGGGQLIEDRTGLHIGRRNFVMMRKLFWKNGVQTTSHDIGGNVARTMRLDLRTGRVILNIKQTEKVLWPL